MRIEVSRISNRINENDVFQYIDHNFEKIATEWFKFQLEWNSSAYTSFKDYEKYLILIYLINKILDFYSKHFIKMNYDEFYSKDKIEIDHFNIIDISKDLKIAKETARRKVMELEKAGVILRLKKKLSIYNVIKRKAFKFNMPEKSVKKLSSLFNNISVILEENRVIKKQIDANKIEKFIFDNFSYCWKLFFEMQIPSLVNWKTYFGDLETWTILEYCTVNQNLEYQKQTIKNLKKKDSFLEEMSKYKNQKGINAMSISNLSGIPRGTVIRKLHWLVKKNVLTRDKKKLYTPKKMNKEIIANHEKTKKLLSIFITKIFNVIIT
tara:strand:+ start:5348 stop:6316 length:969 start_codon:yes stop_codon:yes gene_type:complete